MKLIHINKAELAKVDEYFKDLSKNLDAINQLFGTNVTKEMLEEATPKKVPKSITIKEK